MLFCEAVPVGTVICEIKPEERYTKRLEQAKPVLDALLAWANDLIPRTAPKSALGKALHYLQNAPGLSETDEAWAEKLLPASAPEECYMPQK